MQKRAASFLLCILTLSLASRLPFTEAWASDYQSPRTVSLGGAGHAGPLLNDAIYLNPSFASLMGQYSLYAGYLWFKGESYVPNTEWHGKMLNLSILDGRTELFQAGLGYTAREIGHMLHLGASKKIDTDLGIAVGLSGKMFFSGNYGLRPAQDFTISTTVVPLEWLNTVLILDNVVQSSAGKAIGWEREIILGTKANVMGITMVYLDPHYAPDAQQGHKFGWEAGIEFGVFKDLFLRVGHFKNAYIPFVNDRGETGFGFGAGWFAPRLSLDYGLSHVIRTVTGKPTAVAHTFSATIYL